MRTEVWMCLRFTRSEALLMIVAEEPVQEIDRLVRDVPLVLRGSEPGPSFLRVAVSLLGSHFMRGAYVTYFPRSSSY